MDLPIVEDVKLWKGMDLDSLIKEMKASGGFTAKKLAVGVDILEEMVNQFFAISFPASIIATGTRGVIREMIKKGMVDLIITTCGSIDHDLARNLAGNKRKYGYYQGSFQMDDVELHQKGINRVGNVLIPNENWKLLEKEMRPILGELAKEKNEWSTRELLWEFGKRSDEESMLYWIWKNRVPIYIPGPMDGAFGSQIWSFHQDHPKFMIDLIKDEDELAGIMFEEKKKMGALIIGGGISKHHLIWWSQFRGGLDSAVYITTAPEWDGSLSGARMKEAVSWGKLKEKAKYVTIEGEATTLLPLMIGALIDRLE